MTTPHRKPLPGPVGPDGRRCTLPLKGCLHATAGAVCPHCGNHQEINDVSEGAYQCPSCLKTFFLRITLGHHYLTSQRSIIHEFLWN